jgi:hypothetical protein
MIVIGNGLSQWFQHYHDGAFAFDETAKHE